MKNLAFFLLAFFCLSSSAQIDTSNQKDLADVFRQVFRNKKEQKTDTTARKVRRVYFTFLPGFGYSQEKGFAIVNNTNASFYNHKDTSAKISSIDVNLEYTQYKQFLFRGGNNIWTKHNRFFIKGDWRYLLYSTKAYGIGGVNHDTDAELINYNHLRFYQLLLHEVIPHFLVGIGYNLDYRWKIRSDQSNGNFINEEIRNYGLNSNSTSSGISLNFLYDPRKNQNNPSKGIYGNLIYRYNAMFMGSNSNWTSLLLDLRKYITFPKNSNNVLAFWNYNWFTLSGKQPYFDLPGNGWDSRANTSRAYRQGRFMAKNMVYAETEYRFDVSRNGLFAGVVYANILSVTNKENTKFDRIIPGVGGGIRILTNKYSGTHFILTYSVGINKAQGFSINIGEAF